MSETTLHSRERDPGRAQAIADRGLILRTTVGSQVLGLTNPGTDDRDELGVCIEPPAYLLGLRRFEHLVFRTQPEGAPSGPGDLDLTVYGLQRFCALAAKGSPTVLLPLFVDGEHLVARTELGLELQDLAPAFISRAAGRAFLGYLGGQRRGLTGERHATRTRERSVEHGYDTKYAMHALRIGLQGVELLTTGRLQLPIPEPARSALREVRSGAVPLAEVLVRLDRVTAELAALIDASDLPEGPDADRVDGWLASAYRRAWDAGAYATD